MLLKRTQQQARPPIELDASIPPQVSSVVMKCLEKNRDQRYAEALDIVHDLGQQTLTTSRTALSAVPAIEAPPASPLPALRHRNLLIGIGAAVVVLAIVVVAFRARIFPGGPTAQPATAPQTALAILPLRNASGDSSLDWLGPTLAELLRTDVGQSSSLYPVSSDRLQQIVSQVSFSPSAELDADALHRIAQFTGANLLVWGQYTKDGDRIHIDAKIEDLKKKRVTPLKADAAGDSTLLATVDQLADSLRGSLGLAPKAVQEMKAAAFRPTSNSIEAIRDYTAGMQLLRQRNQTEAAKQFLAATKADPSFALAYSRLGRTYSELGNEPLAEQAASTAMSLSGTLTPVEKYMIQAANGEVQNNYSRALDAYAKLVEPDAQRSPDSPRFR